MVIINIWYWYRLDEPQIMCGLRCCIWFDGEFSATLNQLAAEEMPFIGLYFIMNQIFAKYCSLFDGFNHNVT